MGSGPGLCPYGALAVTTRVVPGAALLLSWAWIAAISSSTCRRSASSPFNASSSSRLCWSISGYAEKRTRTSTPLRALEPESSLCDFCPYRNSEFLIETAEEKGE